MEEISEEKKREYKHFLIGVELCDRRREQFALIERLEAVKVLIEVLEAAHKELEP